MNVFAKYRESLPQRIRLEGKDYLHICLLRHTADKGQVAAESRFLQNISGLVKL